MTKSAPPPLLVRSASLPVSAPTRVQSFIRTGDPDKVEKRRLQLYVSQPVFRSLSVYCAQEDLAMSDVAEQAIQTFLKARGALEG